jgi:predicted membrane protein
MTKPWQVVVLVLIALSLILAIMDRSLFQPMYLLVLALVVMYGTNTKFPWG